MAALFLARLLVCGALAAGLAGEPPVRSPEPLDDGPATGRFWLDPTTPVRVDPSSTALFPLPAGRTVQVTFQFRPWTAAARLTLDYTPLPGRRDDELVWEVSPDGREFCPVDRPEGRRTPRTVVLDDWLRVGQPLFVRVSLTAAEYPVTVGVRDLVWRLDGVDRIPGPAGTPPRGEWLFPAWAARRGERQAPGRPPGRPIGAGLGRRITTSVALDTLAPVCETEPGRVRQIVVSPGPAGGGLSWPGRLEPVVATAGLPLGLRLDQPLWLADPAPRLRFAGELAEAMLLETGPLEIRQVGPRFEGQLLWLTATVVNHTDRALEGTLTAITEVAGKSLAASGGAEFPPGAWLAEVALPVGEVPAWRPAAPASLPVSLHLDDSRRVSDAVRLTVARRSERFAGGRWWRAEAPLEPVGRADEPLLARLEAAAGADGRYVPARLPLDPRALALAERLGAALVIETPGEPIRAAAELLLEASPVVLGVVAVGAGGR